MTHHPGTLSSENLEKFLHGNTYAQFPIWSTSHEQCCYCISQIGGTSLTSSITSILGSQSLRTSRRQISVLILSRHLLKKQRQNPNPNIMMKMKISSRRKIPHMANPNGLIFFTQTFTYSDDGSQFEWSGIWPYPTHAEKYFEQLCQDSQDNTDVLLPDVNIMSMNDDQQFAYNITMNAVIDHSEGKYVSLRRIVAGVAGPGKSYLIKCLVHSIHKYHHNNKAAQVLAPTGNTANLVPGKTIHNFLKVPCGPKCRKDMPFKWSWSSAATRKLWRACVPSYRWGSIVGCNLLAWMGFQGQCGLKGKKS